MPIERPQPSPEPSLEGGLSGAIFGSTLRFVQGIASGAWDFFSFLLARSIEIAADVVEGVLAPVAKPLIDNLLDNPAIPPELIPMLDDARQPRSFAQLAIILAVAAGYVATAVTAAIHPAMQLMSVQANRNFRPTRMTPQEVTEWMLRQPGRVPDWASELADLGFDDSRINRFGELADRIPPVQDIIRMSVREAFSPEAVNRLNLDTDFPADVVKYAKQQGLSEAWALNYWRAHWENPSITQAFEMYHRGLISEGDIRFLMRINDVLPYWHDKFIGISYNSLTRVDVRRMWQLGVLDDAGVIRAYLDAGYSPENAQALLVFTKLERSLPELRARYKNGYMNTAQFVAELQAIGLDELRAQRVMEAATKNDKADRVVKERELTRSDIINGVKRENLTEEQGVSLLGELGYDRDEATYILSVYAPPDKRRSFTERKRLSVSDITKALSFGQLTPDAAYAHLIELRYDPDDATLMLDILMAQAEVQAIGRLKALAKDDIGKALRRGLLDEAEARRWLLAAGYSEEQATVLITLNRPLQPPEPPILQRRITQKEVLDLYSQGELPRADAIARLLQGGLVEEDTALLIGLIDATKAQSSTVTDKASVKASVVQAVKTGILEAAEGYKALVSLGFDDAEASALLNMTNVEEHRSPASFDEFRELAGQWRRASGELAEVPDQATIVASNRVRALRLEIANMRKIGRQPEDVAERLGELAEAETALRDLLMGKENPPTVTPGDSET